LDAVCCLLPRWFRWIGAVFTGAGIVAAIIRYGWGVKPGMLETRVFALYSQYLDSKYFTIIGNNLMEEVIGLVLLAGFFFLSFSRLKYENSETGRIRIRSLFLAVYFQTALLAVSFIVIYGFGFVLVTILNIYLFFLLFNIIYLVQYIRYRRR
jgi:hypothetical protein